MVSWSTKRQFFYISAVIIVFLFAVALPTFYVTYTAPSCSDGKQNQNELGVDCGGPCVVLCKSAALDLIIHWQRAFEVKDGIYNAVAYIENPNLDSGASEAQYLFKFYDKDNLLIYERRGTTFIPPKKIFGIFESNINAGSRVIARTFFEFSKPPILKKQAITEPNFVISNRLMNEDGDFPRLTALLENRSNIDVDSIEVVAILYDESGNAMSSSRTIVDLVKRGGSVPITFTWPNKFINPVTRTELLYRVIGLTR